MRFFEITFGNPEKECARVCIKGTRKPTLEEAINFCRKDAECYKLPVTNLQEITKEEAENDYDFSATDNYPVFGE